MRIESLTPEQIALMPVYRDRWIKIGLSTVTDKPAAEKAIDEVYRCAGREPPTRKAWAGSPLSGAFADEILHHALHSQHVTRSVRQDVWQAVGQDVRQDVWQAVGQAVGQDVGQAVWQAVGQAVWQAVGQAVGQAGYGAHDASWLAFYEFFREVCGLDVCAKLAGLTQLAQHCGWYWPREHSVILTPNPSTLYRDDNGRLHAEDRMSISYENGWGIFAWHGVRVDERVIMQPQTITTKEIEDEKNVEQRRVRMERYGMDRYLDDAGAKLIQHDGFGELFAFDRFKEQDREVAMYVRVKCPSTGRRYVLRVPPDMRTAKDAVAWTFDVKPEQYAPKQEG